MKNETTEKLTITLPSSLYHSLRNKAHKQAISLPEFIQKKIQLRPNDTAALAELPLKELIEKTTPTSLNADARIDFYG
ncbi:MAG: hypothetical protein KJO21_04570 [Verrucomicrobiae bacterium]|nr:hypothetical protein [Verrucomicrobiae bacterium]NNJ42997.1 hypothetical protein [Akkermansiaceae bacterium]